MKYKVVGTQLVNYISKRSGEPVKGVNLFVTCKDPQVNGELADKIFISDRLGIDGLFSLPLGCTVDVQYNNYGHAVGVDFVK